LFTAKCTEASPKVLGQALLENLVYDVDTGQLLTGTYMDYGMPRAHHLAPINAVFNPVP
jgi:carbon-monoxide dehydrogenase large subunit